LKRSLNERILTLLELALIEAIRILEIPMEKVWPYLLIVFGAIMLIYAIVVWTTGKEVIAEKYEE